MKSYNIKCKGCGIFLHNDINVPTGYVKNFNPDKTKYCQKCFQLKHYNKTLDLDLNNTIEQNLKKIDLKNSICFIVLDILNLNNSMIKKELVDSAEQIIFVINKIDCLPKQFNFELTKQIVQDFIESFKFKNYEIIYTSTKINNSIKRLNDFIKTIKLNKNIYFIGKTNTGKTSIINALLKINKQNSDLISSPYINTTIDFKKIILNKHKIIDTPGFIDQNNILKFVDQKYVKKIFPLKGNSFINYFLNPEQSILIEKLCSFNYIEGEKTSFTFYCSKELNLLRCKLSNSLNNLVNENIQYLTYNLKPIKWKTIEFNLDPQKKYNLCICGLGLISIKNKAKKISITINEEILVTLSEYAII